MGVMPIGLAKLRVLSKFNEEDWKKVRLGDLDNEEKETIYSSSHAYSTIHADITNGYEYHFQVFYTLPWFRDEYDLYYVNREINPSTHSAYSRRTLVKMAHIGFKFSYTIR